MVFILHPKKYQYSNGKKNVMYKLQSEVAIEEEPDPIMKNIQESQTVEDLEEMKGSGFRGSGFRSGSGFRGGSMKSQPQNEKLRKFVSLKIR